MSKKNLGSVAPKEGLILNIRQILAELRLKSNFH